MLYCETDIALYETALSVPHVLHHAKDNALSFVQTLAAHIRQLSNARLQASRLVYVEPRSTDRGEQRLGRL